jgi:2-methylcitrate dehydratase PrpD
MAKPFHVGQSARSGLFAVLLAENGMTANPDAMEHSQGFLPVFNGPGTYDAGRIVDSWADPLDIISPGVAVKRHPCCGSTHPALDALLELRRTHNLNPQNVRSVESWTHPRRFKHTNRPDPQTGLDGKFSVQYVLARALAQGFVGLDDFGRANIHDPSIRAIMAKIRSAADPEARMDTSEHFYARVRVVTNSGEILEKFVDRPVGRDRDHPLPEGALEAKFRDCAAQTQSAKSIDEVVDGIMSLDRLGDIRTLSEILASGAQRRPTDAGKPSRAAAG